MQKHPRPEKNKKKGRTQPCGSTIYECVLPHLTLGGGGGIPRLISTLMRSLQNIVTAAILPPSQTRE